MEKPLPYRLRLVEENVTESCPRSDENFDHWAEITDAKILTAEVGEVDGECVEVEVGVEVTWASGSGCDDDEADCEQETQDRTFWLTVVCLPDGPYIDQVEE